jgi:nitrite reductase/ring-hydroxylating ferredoxin subunit
MFNRKSYLLLLFFVFLLTACKEDEYIPYTPVNISIDVYSALYGDINVVGGYMYITGGYKGIIIYRKSQEEFVTMERACPYKPLLDCERLAVDDSTLLFVKDDCCGSKFLITDGSIINGPATKPAKLYNNSFDGRYLYIYN